MQTHYSNDSGIIENKRIEEIGRKYDIELLSVSPSIDGFYVVYFRYRPHHSLIKKKKWTKEFITIREMTNSCIWDNICYLIEVSRTSS